MRVRTVHFSTGIRIQFGNRQKAFTSLSMDHPWERKSLKMTLVREIRCLCIEHTLPPTMTVMVPFEHIKFMQMDDTHEKVTAAERKAPRKGRQRVTARPPG